MDEQDRTTADLLDNNPLGPYVHASCTSVPPTNLMNETFDGISEKHYLMRPVRQSMTYQGFGEFGYDQKCRMGDNYPNFHRTVTI